MLPVTILGPSPGSSDLGVDTLAGPLSGTGCRAVRYVPLVRGRAEPRGSSERSLMGCGCAVRARLLAPDTDPLGLGVVLGGDELRRGGRGRPSAAVEKDNLGEVSPIDLAAVEIGRTGRKASDLAAVQVAREVLDLPALRPLDPEQVNDLAVKAQGRGVDHLRHASDRAVRRRRWRCGSLRRAGRNRARGGGLGTPSRAGELRAGAVGFCRWAVGRAIAEEIDAREKT